MPKREEIRIRDPFILTDKEKGVYYMYGTTALENGLRAGDTFSAYVTKDLENFEGPFEVFNGSEIGFWATFDYWAPEVHKYNGKYYLLGSMKGEGKCRATHIFVSETPLGKFRPVTQAPITPAGWECLDGTLWVENGVPYLVFCHEWLQVGNGEIWAMPLTDDLTAPAGEKKLLFRAGDHPQVVNNREASAGGASGKVTDGPFLFEEGGKLKMIWSSFIEGGKYAVLEAVSDGGIFGKWEHKSSRYGFDGGHAMLFDGLDGVKRISLHAPNTPPNERAAFFKW
ncbi:MAG: family 43 glycosylhydrolase [Clostridia bacterium]|nr:family 43 glycosylhydrolase [Clostridia bacterium]